MHMCFGNYRARAVGQRSYRPLFPHIGRATVNQLALEFASREMAEIELLAELPETMDVAVGPGRRQEHLGRAARAGRRAAPDRARSTSPPNGVSVTPDCGFSQTARHIAVGQGQGDGRRGVRIVRRELSMRAR